MQEPTASASVRPPTYEECVALVLEKNLYKLDKVVDFENRGVDLHLTVVANEVVEWRLLVPYLGLTEVEKSDILNCLSNPALQRTQAFCVWKKKLGPKATYGCLLRALLDAKCASGAVDKIVDILNKPGPVMASNTETDHPSTTSSGSSSIELPQVDLGPYFPYLPAEGRSEGEMKRRQFKLHEETEKIRNAFSSVVFDLKKNVEQTCKLEDVTTILKSYNNNCFEEPLKDCKTLGEVFDKISGFVSFFDYNIIKLLCRKLGSVAVKKKLFKYKKRFQEFSKRRVCECPCNAFGEEDDSEVVYVIKMDKSLETLTVEEVQKLEYSMNRILGHELLRLLSIEEGCVQLKFRTLKSNCLEISTIDQQALRKLGVLSVCHGNQLVDVSAVKGNEFDDDSDSGFQTGSTVTETVERVSGIEEDDFNLTIQSPESSIYNQYKARDLHDPRLEMMEEAQVGRKKLPTLSSLYKATYEGNLEQVKVLVEGGANPLAKDINNDTLLHYAAMEGQLDILKYLIEDIGCNPSTDGFLGGTVLHAAARSKQLHIVKYLVEDCQLDPTALDDVHQSTLTDACLGGDLDIVRFLIENMHEYMDIEDAIYADQEREVKQQPESIFNHDSFQQEPLSCACYYGHLPVVKYLVEECGCNPLRLEGSQNKTALEAAVVGNHLKVLKYLASTEHVRTTTNYKSELPLVFYATVRRKSNPQMITYLVKKLHCDPLVRFNGYAPIHWAAMKGNLEIIKYFIENLGCTPNLKTKIHGRFEPIHLATRGGYLDIVRYLLEKQSCNPSAQCSAGGLTPLFIAVLNGHLDLVRYLTIKHKCDPMQIVQLERIQLSSVHEAAFGGHLSMLRHFFEKMRCDPNQQGPNAYQPIHCAAEMGHIDIVKYFIEEQKVDPESVQAQHMTVLCMAVLEGHHSMVRYLIEERKCNVHTTTSDNSTLLHVALYKENLDMLKYLVKFLNPIEGSGNGSLLHYACNSGQLEITKYLITEVGMDKDLFDQNGSTALSIAANRGDLPLVKYLLEIGSMHQDRNQYSPLHCAAHKGHLELVEFLMDSHPDMYTCNTDESPLKSAVIGGQLHIVKYLIEDRNCNSSFKESLIHHAACDGHFEIVKYLVEDLGHDPNLPNEAKVRPILIAAGYGHLKITKYLIEDQKCDLQGPNLSGSDHAEGVHPIHSAALAGQLKVVRYLIEEQKCNPNLPCLGNDNQQPIHCAACQGHLNVVKYLVEEQKVNPNVTDDLHTAAIHVASKAGHLNIIKYLVEEQGCDINIGTVDGDMPIHIATTCGHFDIIKYLVKELHCDPDIPNSGESRLSPIFLAVHMGNLKMVKFLVEVAGSNPSRGHVFNRSYIRTPLQYAYDDNEIFSDIFLYLAMVLYQSYQ